MWTDEAARGCVRHAEREIQAFIDGDEVLGGTILALQGAENVPLLVQDVGPTEFDAERSTWMGVGEEDDGESA